MQSTYFYKIFFCFLLLWTIQSFSKTYATLQLQIIQAQINLDANSIKNAEIIKENEDQYVLHLTLNQNTADNLEKITEEGIHKTLNIVYNNKIISSTTIQTKLSNNILIPFSAKEAAEAFLQQLKS